MNEYLIRLKRFIYREFDPVTKSLVLVTGLVYILSLLFSGLMILNLNELFILNPVNVFLQPWTIVTYPLANPDIFSLIFGLLWLWFIGGSLERSLGSKTYGWFLALVTLLTGLAMAFTGYLFALAVPIGGLWLPLVGLTWAWANLNPYQELLFWGLIPVKAQWLAWIQALLTFLTYLQLSHNLIFSLAAMSGIAVAYFFRGRNPLERNDFGAESREAAAKRARRSRFRVIK
ncbi:MAG TPA: rhomboid family intramembrane serine protease [Bacillota bacterium]|nr:rhomboid family intramembrane serine protease [Bacillota bacterium]